MGYPVWKRGMFPADEWVWQLVICPYCKHTVYAKEFMEAECHAADCAAPPCDIDHPVHWVEEAPTAEEIEAERRRGAFIDGMMSWWREEKGATCP